jgi:hypothetical protein
MQRLTLDASAADQAKIRLDGKGDALPGAPLPLVGTVVAQLVNGTLRYRATSVAFHPAPPSQGCVARMAACAALVRRRRCSDRPRRRLLRGFDEPVSVPSVARA